MYTCHPTVSRELDGVLQPRTYSPQNIYSQELTERMPRPAGRQTYDRMIPDTAASGRAGLGACRDGAANPIAAGFFRLRQGM